MSKPTTTQLTLVALPPEKKEKATTHKWPAAARPDLGEGGNLRPVVDLLVEQIECADFVILNKIDQLDAAQLESLKGIASSLNPLSKVRLPYCLHSNLITNL